MTNTTRRYAACLVALGLLGLLVAVMLPNKQASTEVVTGDEPTTQDTVPATSTTTEVPETTTAASTTTTVVPATTVVETTSTTNAPEPPTTVAESAPVAAAAVESQSVEPQAAALPDVIQTPEPVRATREGPVCTTDPEYCNPPPAPEYRQAPDWAACPQWWELAQQVGWPASDMSTLDYVMKRESGCNPDAYNRSGATGLLQIIGGCAPYGGCRDPEANLRRGLDMRQDRGWQPWQVCGFSRSCNGRG